MRRQAGVFPPLVATVSSYRLAASESRECQIRSWRERMCGQPDTWSTTEHLKQDKLRWSPARDGSP